MVEIGQSAARARPALSACQFTPAVKHQVNSIRIPGCRHNGSKPRHDQGHRRQSLRRQAARCRGRLRHFGRNRLPRASVGRRFRLPAGNRRHAAPGRGRVGTGSLSRREPARRAIAPSGTSTRRRAAPASRPTRSPSRRPPTRRRVGSAKSRATMICPFWRKPSRTATSPKRWRSRLRYSIRDGRCWWCPISSRPGSSSTA